MGINGILVILFSISTVIGLWKLFGKAGEKGWKALIPFYNFYIWLKLIDKPWWWLLLIIIPGINILIIIIMSIKLSRTFGQKTFLEDALAGVIPFIFFPYLGFKTEVKYLGIAELQTKSKSIIKEWGDAIIFAVIAATIIRTFFIEAFTIPTSSMEKSLMIGDYLFVSKLSFGPKIQNTPLSFPFAHHTLPFTENTKSYLEWIKLPYLRLPGFSNVKNNDIVVFNYPDGDTVAVNAQDQSYYQLIRDYGRKAVMEDEYINPQTGKKMFGKIIARPVDKRENYIKRCTAVAGDTVLLKKRELYINGHAALTPIKMQYNYHVKTNGMGISPKLLEKLDITDPIRMISNTGDYEVTIPEENIKKLKSYSNIISIEPIREDSGIYSERIFPHSANYKWNVDNFGPLYIPKKGVTIALDTFNLPLYTRIIEVYENNKLKVSDGKIFINDKEAHSYTFKMNYYFMMGDNRHNSADSRYWGYVPEDHVVGKAVFIWLSVKQNMPFKDKFRTDRIFTYIGNEGLSRSYFLPFVIVLGITFLGSYFIKKRKVKSGK